MPLKQQVAIVTGAGSGLGRQHALFLARKGAQVAVIDIDKGAASVVAEEINASGGRALAFVASVTDETAIGEMVAHVMQSWGRVDILVNNAGILRDKSFGKMSLDDFGCASRFT